jgi:nitrate/TMAO reductase-like tetraheme cytochrome c subunit
MKRLFLSFVILLTFHSVAIAGYREDFEKEFLTKPWAGQRVEESACIECHSYTTMPKSISQEIFSSLHYQYNVSCHDCHGGDPKDSSLAMSHERGFAGVPKYTEVPEFCGKCHVGILEKYLESGHGQAVESTTRRGPNCVVCHGSHKGGRYIKKANIHIINEQLCTKCHDYERAKIMKQALLLVEKKIEGVEKQISDLKEERIFEESDEKQLFSIHAEFRTLFHAIDVSLIKSRSDEFIERLNRLEMKIQDTVKELQFRRNFSAFFMLVFVAMAITVLMLPKSDGE